ncbi:MAG: ferredoxin, partial [Gammaproteobacteria bacterium]|nr:ferredoxin [Gammaproteobacteria bacterium]
MSDWVLVARLADLEANRPVSVDLDDERVMLARTDDDVVALEDLCTHDGAEISSGC